MYVKYTKFITRSSTKHGNDLSGQPYNYTVGIRTNIIIIIILQSYRIFRHFLQTMCDSVCSTYVLLPLALLNTSIWSFSRTCDTLRANGWFICATIFANRHTRFRAVRFCHKTIMDIWRARFELYYRSRYILFTVFINTINYPGGKKSKYVFLIFQLKT